jgi:3-oxoacyl-[acyl-carrier-protein] synthase-3
VIDAEHPYHVCMDRPVYLRSVGTALPKDVLSNEQILSGMPWLDTSADWIREHTGIHTRHVAQPDEHVTDLGQRAACQAFDRANVSAADTDLVILATNTSPFVYPSSAAVVQGELAKIGYGMPRAAALDLQQGCASFVAAIILAKAMVQSGQCQQALVIGAEVATRMVDWTDRSSLLLGDGACACVLTCEAPPADRDAPCLELLSSFMKTVPDTDSVYQRSGLDVRNHPRQHMAHAASLEQRIDRDVLYQRLLDAESGANQHFYMDGRKVYRFVRRTVPGAGFFDVLHRAALITDDELARAQRLGRGSRDDPSLRSAISERVDRFVPHGANLSLDQELAEQLHIPYQRMALTLQDHGNTSSASVGIALDRIMRGGTSYETVAKRDGDGQLTRAPERIVVDPVQAGHNVVLLSFGAGTSWNYVAARAI